MSYGVRMWGADGALQFNTDTATWRIVLSAVVSFAGQGKSTQQFLLPGCNPSNTTAVVLPIGPSADSDRQLETEVSDGVIYVRNFINGYAASMVSNSTMRLVVMRWY